MQNDCLSFGLCISQGFFGVIPETYSQENTLLLYGLLVTSQQAPNFSLPVRQQ